MPASDLQVEVQHDWDADSLRGIWPLTPDHRFVIRRLADAATEAISADARGRLLEVAAAEGQHACRLAQRGLQVFVVEPSSMMVESIRRRAKESRVSVTLVRGIGERQPFPDATFDHVLCDSALDHFADPECGIHEMARVVKPNGRVVLTFVNYAGATVRASRLVYRAGRALGFLAPETEKTKLFWDSPAPFEHNFECTFANVSDMCRSYLELDHAFGISIGWMFPGWGAFLERVPRLQTLLPRLDRIARDHPALADFVVSVWRPRPSTEWPVDDYRTRPSNAVYQRLVQREAAFWKAIDYETPLAAAHDATRRDRNVAHTGDPERSWVQDLAARGSFRDVALLGCESDPVEVEWLRSGGSERLDVYEPTPGVVARVRDRLGPLAARVRFFATDLNFVELPPSAYDLIWSSGRLHSITNLEHLYAQIDRALRPGGIFALQGYVGEPRLRFEPRRLARVNALLRTVPARFRRTDRITVPDPVWHLSPFQAVRSLDVLPLARARFDVVREAPTARFFPLNVWLDMQAIAREEPALLARLWRAELEARSDPVMRPCGVYAVFRKREPSRPTFPSSGRCDPAAVGP